MKIIIDCMSGDNAPHEIVKGALTGAKQYGTDVVLVGEKAKIEACAAECGLSLGNAGIVEANGPHLTMEDHPGDIMSKERADSSMAVALDCLKNGVGDALISAGNTGALLTGATLKVRRIKGVRRAALGAIIPFGSPTLLADSGAQTDCTPDNLVLFAHMGALYMERVCGVKNPKVALINNGAEEHKGTPLQQETYQLLKNDPAINFIGNIEGREIVEGNADVLVCDGFTGNIVLKMVEGTGLFVKSTLKKLFYKNPATKLGALLCSGAVKSLKKEMSYDEYGGAPFLGIAKPVFKAHGSADATSIAYCIRQAKTYTQSGMTEKIGQVAAQLKETAGGAE